MSTRRNFFRSLALMAGAASISPQIFIPRFEPVIWKPSRVVGGIWVIEAKQHFIGSIIGSKELLTGWIWMEGKFPMGAGETTRCLNS